MTCKQNPFEKIRWTSVACVLAGLVFSSLSCSPTLAQSLYVDAAKWSMIPRDGGIPIRNARSVMFQDALEWFKAGSPEIEDFASIERVEIQGDLSVELSRFVSRFPRLKRLYIGEMPSGFDFGKVLKPFAHARSLRSLEIANVCVDYRDLTIVGEFKGLTEFTCDVLLSRKELLALQKLDNLRYLGIMAVVDSKQVRPLRTCNKTLHTEHPGRDQGSPAAVLFQPLRFPRLRELRVDDPESIAWFDERTPIEKLVVYGRCSVKEIIRIRQFRSLKEVDIAISRFDDAKPLLASKRLQDLTIRMRLSPPSKKPGNEKGRGVGSEEESGG